MRPGVEVEDADVDDLGVEDLLDLVADEVVHRLHVELAGEPLLDAVDERQLGVPLPRLVDQPRVLERDAQALASVSSSRWSDALNASSRSTFSSEMTPVTAPPVIIGLTNSADFASSPAITTAAVAARLRLSRSSSYQQRLSCTRARGW